MKWLIVKGLKKNHEMTENEMIEWFSIMNRNIFFLNEQAIFNIIDVPTFKWLNIVK